MNDQPTSAAPIVRSTHVGRTTAEAFRIFTAEIGAWWPLPTHGIFGAESGGLAFVDDQLVELATDGRESVWGNVRLWDPPHRVVFTWHPGAPDAAPSEVDVEFTADGDGTRVVVEHRGWEAFGDEAVRRRRSYVGPNAWGSVLDFFAHGTEAVVDPVDLSGLAMTANRFFDEASVGGFGSPRDDEWPAEVIVAHVSLNDAAMLAVCQGIAHGNEVDFSNEVCQDRQVLDRWVGRHGDLAGLIAAGRRMSTQLLAALARLSGDERGREVPCDLRSGDTVMLDEPRPWEAIAIDIQTRIHLPSHTEQLVALRSME